ncbi:conserved hypothetical protein [Verticillium alfalfae VaMs.102]|uniref:Uncharacterized protein n=1 Tax=Verticillium alfalfae (strain VaMs.102 / ATCC MYA-4576 / FGSC 10136) TaxID=526221 RepID=C9SVA0_VERA1|nr:conserved hypothetical protein [Verticillium alfalfae VaMs.102]EEY22715.1 conserved hypothetical protein [Verticillium alfalfae VaMs.102]
MKPTVAPLRKKVVHSVDTSFSSVEWPSISEQDQDAILELIISLLAPLGHHRRTAQASKGKRDTKRKRDSGTSVISDSLPKPPAPEIASFVDIGLSAITRNLQEHVSQNVDSVGATKLPYALIFVARSGQASAFNSHYPQLVAVASQSSSSNHSIRLVGYSKPCAPALSASLGIPRVSSVGIRHGAPLSKPLIDFVQNCVPPITIPWLSEAETGQYRHTRLVSEEKMVPSKQATSSAP